MTTDKKALAILNCSFIAVNLKIWEIQLVNFFIYFFFFLKFASFLFSSFNDSFC